MEVDIAKLKEMARIRIAPEKEAKIAESLSNTLSYVNQVVELSGTPNTSPSNLNTAREDVSRQIDSATRDLLIKSFPQKEGDYLKVPKIL